MKVLIDRFWLALLYINSAIMALGGIPDKIRSGQYFWVVIYSAATLIFIGFLIENFYQIVKAAYSSERSK